MTTALEVKNINKKYKNKVVLNDINFSIQSGEIVALIGKNGAGKSTLINIITKLIQQDSGQSKIFEKEKFDRNLIGVMMQENISLDRITVKEIIKLIRTYYRNPMSFELPVIKITGITSRDYITYTILIVHAPNLVIMTGNTTIILKIIFTNYRTCFDSLKVLRIISCY
ncbi:ATP-binding cassette domain-containing protein [Ligilactobacillus salivarius]|uniref:ATP-binding cassette domain-containing protein n=1 Tax=Ligilactobacillus salivarius TaxID=1624 RepID=UPI001CDAD392|nr:ATP-binding cassette domain-containing protein [Ligilactobacillus salivarius]